MYLNIVFLNSYEDQVVTDFFDGNVENDQLFQHLIQWDYGDQELGASVNAYENPPFGTSDTVEKIVVGSDTYYLSYNNGLGYVALARKLS
jgi:hypothetical protein